MSVTDAPVIGKRTQLVAREIAERDVDADKRDTGSALWPHALSPSPTWLTSEELGERALVWQQNGFGYELRLVTMSREPLRPTVAKCALTRLLDDELHPTFLRIVEVAEVEERLDERK